MRTWLGTAQDRRRGLAPRLVIVLVAIAFVGSACQSDDSGRDGSGSAANPDDKLAIVTRRGTLLLPTDIAYPPASFAVKSAARRPDTECAENDLTGREVDGYDVAVSKAVAAALGLEPCFVTPTFTEQLAGNWGDRWDVAFTSIGIVRSRMRNLYFAQPYYATPESFYVRRNGPIGRIKQLHGARIGVCTGCFADLYLRRRLDIPGTEVSYRVRHPVDVGYAVERDGLDDVASGKLDAFLCQETVGDEAISEGLPLRSLDPPAYVAYIGGALDRGSATTTKAFFDRVNGIVRRLHAEGTLAQLSRKYFGKDYASAAARFDLSQIGQIVR
jgi:polar amino acid transport system substrate-binding protein